MNLLVPLIVLGLFCAIRSLGPKLSNGKVFGATIDYNPEREKRLMQAVNSLQTSVVILQTDVVGLKNTVKRLKKKVRKMSKDQDKLPSGKTVIVVFDDADYNKILAKCNDDNIAIATYIEHITVDSLNLSDEETE